METGIGNVDQLIKQVNTACMDIAGGRRLMTALDDIKRATEKLGKMAIWCPEVTTNHG